MTKSILLMAYARTDNNTKLGSARRRVRDISPNRRFVQRLVQLYNRLQLDPDHLYDVVQDAVIDENSKFFKILKNSQKKNFKKPCNL